MTSATIVRARSLRHHASPPERRLWLFLRTLRDEGYHFRRQAPLCGYFVDFVCYSRRLVVEVDGSHHGADSQAAHDAVRDKFLGGEGFRMLRFQATDVMHNLDGVAIMIRQALASPTPLLRSPARGRGRRRRVGQDLGPLA